MWLPEVRDPGAAKVTIRKFYRPSGASTQLKGVVPDIVLPSVENYMEVGEASLENALAWDTIQASKFAKDGEVSRLVPVLNRRSVERVNSDRDFDYVREDVERYRKVKAEKQVSLNEDERRREIAENKARAEARKKELASRKESEPMTWEITLKNADAPGLPAPVTNQVASVTYSLDGAPAKAVEAEAASAEPSEDGEEEEPATTPRRDPHLREAQRVLLDLLRLAPRKGMAARND